MMDLEFAFSMKTKNNNKIFVWIIFIFIAFLGGQVFYFKHPEGIGQSGKNMNAVDPLINENAKIKKILNTGNIFLTSLNGDTILFDSLFKGCNGINILRIPPVSCQLCLDDLLGYLSQDTLFQNDFLIIYTVASLREMKVISKLFDLGNLFATSKRQIFPYDEVGLPYFIKINQNKERENILFLKNNQYNKIKDFLYHGEK